MSDGLKPIRFRRTGDDTIRQDALDRVEGVAATSERPDRRINRRAYPSDISRRRRTVAVCLETEEDMDQLRQAAEQVSATLNRQVSPTGLATLLVSAGLKLLEEGTIRVTTESREIERLTIERD